MTPEVSFVSSRCIKGTRIAFYHWRNNYQVKVPPRGYLWLIHGLGEHLGRYDEFASYCTKAGFDVLGIDFPGHGLSKVRGGQKKLVGMDEALSELKQAWQSFFVEGEDARARRTASWQIFCHSMGAIVGMNWLLQEKRVPDGCEFATKAIVSAPPLALKMKVPAWKASAAKILLNVAPDLEIPSDLKPEQLSRDLVVQLKNRQDKLCHTKASPRLFTSLESSAEDILRRVNDFNIPALFLWGEEDPVVDVHVLESYFKKLHTHKKSFVLNGGRHESINEVNRKEVFEEILAWMLS